MLRLHPSSYHNYKSQRRNNEYIEASTFTSIIFGSLSGKFSFSLKKLLVKK